MSEDLEMKMMCHGAPAPPLEDDNILSMILLRLPPLPSSLPSVSVVCKRWRRVVTHPHFHRRFLAHHKKPPLLGFFCSGFDQRIDFKPALDPPNRSPAARFSSSLLSEYNIVLGCHHGRLLVLNFSSSKKLYLVVSNPITGDHYHVDIPQRFQGYDFFGHRKGLAVCASREKDHVHGACHSEPFQVVLIGCIRKGVLACVYSSETCTWGNLISLLQPQLKLSLLADSQSSLVGNSVYWVSMGISGPVVLEFNLHRQTLATIDAPPEASSFSSCKHHENQYFILAEDGGGLSFIFLSCLNVRVWKRISNDHGVAGWLLKNTVQLSNLLSLKPGVDRIRLQGNSRLVGCDEDDNMIFRLNDSGIVYLVHLKTLQFKELPQKIGNSKFAHPFSSFYTAGMHPETGTRGDENV